MIFARKNLNQDVMYESERDMSEAQAGEVYVLTRDYDYEGETAIGVFGTLERAQGEATRQAEENGWFDPSGVAYPQSELSPVTWALGNGCSSFVVRKETIR